MTRRCSHCSNNGHNSRTCPTRGGGGSGGATSNAAISGGSNGGGVRLFGVRLTDGSFMKKSASMGNLSHYQLNSSSSNTASPNNSNNNNINNNNNNINTKHNNIPNSLSSDNLHGYLSDDPNHASCSSNRRSERKKGKPWTEEEHRLFLVGLKKLGKGDWRGIARNYVVSRTPTQVASHAQKYYIRQSNATRRKRRSSLFDMVTDMVPEEPETVPEEQSFPPPPEPRETDNTTSQPSLNLSLSTEAEPMEATSAEEFKENDEAQPQPQSQALPSNMIPAFSTVFLPLSYPSFWPQGPQPRIHPDEDNKCESSQHQVLKPTPVLRKEPVNVDELVGLHKLNLREAENSHIIPPQLSLNLLGAPSRQSAFHASAPVSSSDLSEGTKNAIQAV